MVTMDDNVAVYEKMRSQLEEKHMGEWVVIYNKELVGTYPTLQEAAETAVSRYGRGPYHIKQIGEPPFEFSPFMGIVFKHAGD